MLVVLDYYSRYIEILKLTTTTSADVICQLKSIIARCGIPEELVSDNGPQYTAEEFACLQRNTDSNTRPVARSSHRLTVKLREL